MADSVHAAVVRFFRQPSLPHPPSPTPKEKDPLPPDCCCSPRTWGAIGSCVWKRDVRPLHTLVLERCVEAAKPVVSFLEGTVVYVLSQQWDDLLSTYLLRLHPLPYCGSQTAVPGITLNCQAEAGADEQFRYVLTLLLVSALLQLYAEIGPLPYRWHAWRTLSYLRFAPRMIGMCIGWAAGNATKATFLITIDTASRGNLPPAVSPLNMTASQPSSTAFAT